MDRKDFWNSKEYLEYFENRVKESNNAESTNNVRNLGISCPPDKLIFSLLEELDMNKGDVTLDFGCGHCRIYGYLSEIGVNYYGIDISEGSIKQSLEKYPELENKLMVSEGESLPFESNFFDKVICFGVFDACYQNIALTEMLRVTKPDGLILISGKNDNYFDDDNEARIAEIAARKKGHPNYFTDIKSLFSQIKDNNLTVKNNKFCLRRGDMADYKFVETLPDFFYEWCLVLQKSKGNTYKFEEFSNAYSKTFLRG